MPLRTAPLDFLKCVASLLPLKQRRRRAKRKEAVEKKAAAERKDTIETTEAAATDDKDVVEKDTEDIVDEMLETTATVLDDVTNKV